VTDWHWPDTAVTEVVDGDTIDAILAITHDIGFGSSSTHQHHVRLRLNRVNAPKLANGYLGERGRAARGFVIAHTVDPVHVVTIGPYKFGGPKDYTGEWMAEVLLPDGRNLSDLMVENGHAVYWNGQGPRPNDLWQVTQR
jgi:endonuclease YncB( thermonuclease family)